MSGKPAASPDRPSSGDETTTNPQRHVADSRVRLELSKSQRVDIDVTGFYYTDHDYRSVQLYARTGGIACTFSGTPAQARELAAALVKAAAAVELEAPTFEASDEGRAA